MSYELDNTEDDDKKTEGEGDDTSQLSSESGIIAPSNSSSNSAATSTASKPSSSGQWTNLQSYLDTNQDQAARMGSDIAGTINNEGSTAKQSLENNQASFNNSLGSSGASLANDKDSIDSALANPTDWATDDSNVKRFQNDLNGQYTGPKNLSDVDGFNDTVSQNQKAAEDVDLTKSEAGRMTLLENQYKRPDYNQGMKKLDQLLVSGNKDAQSSIAGTRDNWSGLMGNLDEATQKAYSDANGRVSDTKNANDYARNALDNTMSNAQTDLDSRTSNANTERQAEWDRVLANLQQGKASAQDLTMLGLQSGDSLWNVDPTASLTQNGQVSKYQLGSPEEYAKFAALAKLSGQDNTYLPSQYQDQSGKYEQNPFSFDKDRFQTNLANSKRDYDRQTTDALGMAFSPSEVDRIVQNNPDWQNPEQYKKYVTNLPGSISAYESVGNTDAANSLRDMLQKYTRMYNALKSAQDSYTPNKKITGI